MARIIRAGNQWELLTLSEEQKAMLLDGLLKENASLLSICVKEAEKLDYGTLKNPSIDQVFQAGLALFNSLATKSFSRFQDAEVIKTFNEKDQARLVQAVAEAGGSRV